MVADFGDEQEEIIADFIVETEELIERLDQELVQLEENKDDLDLLNSIFRAAHTIKGTSSFLGFTRMTELTHKAENVLDKLRNQEFSVTSEIMDALLNALDGIRTLLDEIREGRYQDGEYDPEPVMTVLIGIVEAGGQTGGDAAPAASASAPAEEGGEPVMVITDDSAGGGSDLDALLASAPAVEPKLEIPGESAPAAAGGGDDLDALLASAPVVEPKITIPGESAPAAAGGGDSLDDILNAAPAVDPKLELPPQKSEAKPATEKKQEVAAQKLARDASKSGAAKPAKKEDGHKIAVEQTIRVDVERLDALMNLTGELVLNRNRLANITRQLEQTNLEIEAVAELANIVASISHLAGDLQMAVMKTRMLPIGKVFNRFPRMVRDLAREKKKLVDLKINGAETEVDKSVIEAIGDPLVHLIRNSVDHGIESPEDRKAAGKGDTGEVILSAMHQGNHVVITIEDNGKGIDTEIIKDIALKRGVVDESQAARMTPKEIRLLIFQPGFSTAKTITNTSGRGVGMDVVKTNVETLGGTIDIESELGAGTTMAIKLPLTLAIIQALMVRASMETYAISLANVIETVRVPLKRIQTVEGQSVVQLRDRVIPVVKLSDVLECPDPGEEEMRKIRDDQIYIVVLGLGEQRVGLAVESLLGQEEVVIKSLGDYLKSIPGIAGSTILGDGRVALIVDVAGLMQMIYGNAGAAR